MNPFQSRQGDVLLNPVDNLPELEDKHYEAIEGEAIKDMIILAHGESTGHRHAFINANAILVKEKNGPRFFVIVNNPSILTHQEHGGIVKPKGFYEVIKQREQYSPTEIRYVVD